MKFSVYFMGYESAEDIPDDEAHKTKFMLTRRATIELTQLSITKEGFRNYVIVLYH